jgi:hypothetical protein
MLMNVTLAIDEQLVTRARKKADALGKSLDQLIGDYLQKLLAATSPSEASRSSRNSLAAAIRVAGASIEAQFMSVRSSSILTYFNIIPGAVRIPKLEPAHPPHRFSLDLPLHLR